MIRPLSSTALIGGLMLLAYGCSSDEPGPNSNVAGQAGHASGGRGIAGAANSGGLNPLGGHAGTSVGTGGTSASGNTSGHAGAGEPAIAGSGGTAGIAGAPIAAAGAQGFGGDSAGGGGLNGGASSAGASNSGGIAGAATVVLAGQAGAGQVDAGKAGAAGHIQAGTSGATSTATAGASGAADSANAGTAGAAGSAIAAQDPRCATASTSATLTAHLKITADNECDVYVNGQSVGQTTSWSSAVTLDVSLYVHPGRKNVVAVVGRNTSSQYGNDRGIIGELTTTVGTSTSLLLATDHNWRVMLSPASDWYSLAYDDSAWIPATEIASAGDSPWGNIMGTGSIAKWIWLVPVPASTANKPNLEATYARRVFYFDFAGQLTNAPICNAPDN